MGKNFYVFTGSTVGVVPIEKGLYQGKIDKLGSDFRGIESKNLYPISS